MSTGPAATDPAAGAAKDFAAACATGGTADELVKSCIAGLGNAPAGWNVGFLYATDALDGDLPRILAKLKSGTGIDDWVGTVGFGIAAGALEFFDEPALAVMACRLPEDSYRLLPPMTKPGEEMAGDLPGWVGRARPTLGILHVDPRNTYLRAIMNSLYDDTECYFVGGLTASRSTIHQIAGNVVDGAISGMLIAPDGEIVTGLTQGCSPVGPVRRISRAHNNVIMEIDGRPALDILKEDIGEILARDLSRAAGYIHAALPIARSDTGDYLVRNLVGIDPTSGHLAIGERISNGDKLLFVRRDTAAARQDLDRMIADVTKRLPGPPKAALYYSCIARGPHMFGEESVEMRAIAEALGDIPMIGFYANGEICNGRLYGYTGVLTVFA